MNTLLSAYFLGKQNSSVGFLFGCLFVFVCVCVCICLFVRNIYLKNYHCTSTSQSHRAAEIVRGLWRTSSPVLREGAIKASCSHLAQSVLI